MAYNGNIMRIFLHDFLQNHAELGTFGEFLHGVHGLL